MASTMWGPVTMAGDPTDPSNYGVPSGSWPPGVAQISRDATAAPGLAASVGPVGVSVASPDNPLFWVAALLAITVGAVGFNAHARVLNVRAGVDVGKD